MMAGALPQRSSLSASSLGVVFNGNTLHVGLIYGFFIWLNFLLNYYFFTLMDIDARCGGLAREASAAE